jgi:DNA-binding transcriptional LysR family regulator
MRLDDLDLNDVLGFVRVVDAGGYSGAARKLGVPKSSLSRRVARLESALGARLLHRTSRAFALTDGGRELHARAAHALGLLGDAAQAAVSGSEVPRGTVHLGAPPGVGAELLPPLIAAFVSRYPQARVVVELALPHGDLIEAGLDLAIRPGPLRDSSLARRKLQDMPFKLFAAPACFMGARPPRTLEELMTVRCILFGPRRDRARWTLHGDRGRAEITVHGAVSSDDISFVRRAAVAGAGVALLPEIVGERLVLTGALIRVLPEYRVPQHPLYLVYPAGPQLPLVVAKLRDHLLERFVSSTETATVD